MPECPPVREENKMGTMPVNRLLISVSVPMMISMLVQALYNVVDSMFVSYISENALTAVSLAFPMQNLMISVAVGTGVGMNALLSRSLGERNFDRVNQAANNGVLLGLLSCAFFVLIGFFGMDVYFRAQTDVAEIIEYGKTYLSICTIYSVGLFGQVTFARLLQSTGKTFFSMVQQLAGALFNIIFDPIMIFGLLGCPRMGVAGAAIATVLGQAVGALLGIFFNFRYNKEIALSLDGMKPHLPTIKRIYSVGLPSIIMSSLASVMTFGLNKILFTFTSTAAAVLGVYFKLQSFIFMPVFGLNNGMVPIISYNFGARKPDRIMKTLRLSILYAVSILLVGMFIFQVFTPQLIGIFHPSPEMLAIGVPALRTISLSYLFPGFCIIVISLCQALGHGLKSLLISVVRQLVVLLPAAWLLSLTGRLELIWYAFPIAEIAGVCMCVYFLLRIYREEIKPLEALPDEFCKEQIA